jgi:hypothetical protein
MSSSRFTGRQFYTYLHRHAWFLLWNHSVNNILPLCLARPDILGSYECTECACHPPFLFCMHSSHQFTLMIPSRAYGHSMIPGRAYGHSMIPGTRRFLPYRVSSIIYRRTFVFCALYVGTCSAPPRRSRLTVTQLANTRHTSRVDDYIIVDDHIILELKLHFLAHHARSLAKYGECLRHV